MATGSDMNGAECVDMGFTGGLNRRAVFQEREGPSVLQGRGKLRDFVGESFVTTPNFAQILNITKSTETKKRNKAQVGS